MTPKQKEEAILMLLAYGLQLVEIDERVYIYTVFVPADKVIPKHKLVGVDITEILPTLVYFGEINDMKRQELQTKVNGIKTVQREFHEAMLWKTYNSL